MKRVEANDPNAISGEGRIQFFVKEDYRSAFEYFTKASDLGDANAHIMLAQMYRDGKGVENDRGKKIHHLEEAAVRGHPPTLDTILDATNGRMEILREQ